MKRRGSPKTQEITAINLRHHLGEVLDKVSNRNQRFLIKRAGTPAAVLLNVSDYKDLEDLFDTWREQRDNVFQMSLLEARKEIEQGKVATMEDLQKDLRKDLRVKKKRSNRQ